MLPVLALKLPGSGAVYLHARWVSVVERLSRRFRTPIDEAAEDSYRFVRVPGRVDEIEGGSNL